MWLFHRNFGFIMLWPPYSFLPTLGLFFCLPSQPQFKSLDHSSPQPFLLQIETFCTFCQFCNFTLFFKSSPSFQSDYLSPETPVLAFAMRTGNTVLAFSLVFWPLVVFPVQSCNSSCDNHDFITISLPLVSCPNSISCRVLCMSTSLDYSSSIPQHHSFFPSTKARVETVFISSEKSSLIPFARPPAPSIHFSSLSL